METPHVHTSFYRATLSAVFAGIFATVLCLAYDIFYRDATGFSLSGFITVSSIIFIVNIIFLLAGVIYAIFVGSFKKADLIFEIVFLALIAFVIFIALGINRSPIHEQAVQFRGLFIGILVILAIGIVAIPMLYHNRKFEESVL
jgi:hypothetical protein